MEDYEKEAIMASMEFICSQTTNTEEIICLLYSIDVLTSAEVDEVISIPGSHERISKLLQKLMKKSGAMRELLSVFRQTGNYHIRSHLEIKLKKKKEEAENEKIKTIVSEIFERLLDYLCQNTKHVERITDHLTSDSLLTMNDKVEIKVTPSNYFKNYELYSHVQGKNVPIKAFLKILKETENEEIADCLEKELKDKNELLTSTLKGSSEENHRKSEPSRVYST